MKNIHEQLEKHPFSRRVFLQSTLAVGAAATLAGCGSSGSDDVYVVGDNNSSGSLSQDIYYSKDAVYRYGTTSHNCGGRCITRAQVTPDGRIVRFLTDETKFAYDGTPIGMENRNCTQSRACARCRAYKGRLYHPGRLKYPLKQTKKRGDMTGFERITWKQALTEITDRLKAVQNKYGKECLHAIYACGAIATSFQGASYTGMFASTDWDHAATLRLLGGSSQYTSDYSFHQGSYMGAYSGEGGFSGLMNMSPNANTIAGTNKHVVLWGSNIPSTHNPKAYSWIKSMEDMKKRDPEASVVFIGPEFSECGIAIADEWIQIKPYTDVALIHGMLYHMIDNTVAADGSLKSNPWLDLDYLDTCVYGFFDSPEYYMDQDPASPTAGTISATPVSGYTKVDAVPAGRSLSAYVMGNDDRLTKINYGTSNYIAAQYTAIHGSALPRNGAACSYAVPASTKFAYKKDMKTPKTPAWASAITGVPEERIKQLAKMYIDAAKNGDPIWNEWAGGQLKQAEGCTTLYGIQCLLAVTGNWGVSGTGIANNTIGRVLDDVNKKEIADSIVTPATWAAIPIMTEHPKISVTQWHNAIKYAFGDKMKANGYVPNIPDWTEGPATGRVYASDGGVKSLVKRNSGSGIIATTYTDGGRTYFEYDGRGTTGPVYSGFRFILNTGGNIPINQHMNCIDSSRMYETLPTYGYTTTALNVDIADAFYLVTFDNFMSPSARYSDYVLPAKTAWEQEDFVSIEGTGNLYVDAYIPGPGESMSTWDFARELVKAYGGPVAATGVTGRNPDASFGQVVQDAYNTKIKDTNIVPEFSGKSWEEFLVKPIIHSKPSTVTPYVVAKNSARQAYDDAKSANALTSPVFLNIGSFDANRSDGMFGVDQFAETDTCPQQSKRLHVYSGSLVWRYENLYSKWHGHLPVEQQGQNNEDEEGNPIVYPLPLYYDYHDFFREAYGLASTDALKGRYLLTTTHDRFRAHSSQSENPYLRELTHRVIGGGLYSGNDSNAYATSLNANGDMDEFPAINTLIGPDGLPVAGAENKASYADIWVNDLDFAEYNDGDLVRVENEIGAVYCTLRKTKRCVRGYVGLHQGCWFDPRTINGKTVDVGGNCNTLMASKPSRIDHGNAQQSAMVTITKVR